MFSLIAEKRILVPQSPKHEQRRKLQRFGHGKRDMKDGGCLGSEQEMHTPGKRPQGRPHSWKKVINENLDELGIDEEMAYDRKLWRNVIGASQTPA